MKDKEDNRKYLKLADVLVGVLDEHHINYTGGEVVLAIATVLGFMVRYRNDGVSLEHTLDNVNEMVRVNAEVSEKVKEAQAKAH